MKKLTKKEKAKVVWHKIRKPLMICSFILNGLFILIAIIGCSTAKPVDQNNNNNKLKRNYANTSTSEIVQVTDLTGTQWEFKNSGIKTTPFNFGSSTSSHSYYLQMVLPDYSPNGFNTFQLAKSVVTETNLNCKVGFMTTAADHAGPNLGGGNLGYSYNGSSWTNQNRRNINILSGYDATNSDLIAWFYNNATLLYAPEEPYPTNEPVKVDDIILGDGFVPTIYICDNSNFLFNGFLAKVDIEDYQNYLDFDGLTFESNGKIYNKIRFFYQFVTFVTDDGTSYKDLDGQPYMFCHSIRYLHLNEENLVDYGIPVAHYKNALIQINGNYVEVPDVRQPYLIWNNEEFRKLHIIDNDNSIQSASNLTIQNLTTAELLLVTSNITQSLTGLTNIADVLKTGFGAFNDLFRISVLPGITIGLLLFIPLIVTILLSIIKLVKK